MITFSNLDTSIQEKSIYYFHKEKIMASPLEINMEIEIKEPVHASLILSKINPIFELKTEESLKISIDSSKKNKSKIYLRFQKTSGQNEILLGAKDKMIEIELTIEENANNLNEISYFSIKLSFLIEKNEIKILYSKNVIYSGFIDTRKLFGNYVYILLESSKDMKKENFKEFSICYLKSSPKPLRYLQESTVTQLEYIEVDEYSIKTSPNILKEGNAMIIPTVKLNPKDKNGNFPSDILSYTHKQLKNLFNLTHSKNGTIFYQVAILSKKELIMNIETEIPGEISINSRYFKNGITYVLTINKTELDISETVIEIDEQSLISGNNSIIKIIPRSKYQTPIAFLEESDIEKFEVTITLPNKTVINAEKGKFDSKEKAIIFEPKLNFKGEAFIEIKYGDIIIPCKNCNISVSDKDFENENIPNPNYTEIFYYTEKIVDDVQPIIILVIIKDDYLNYIFRKDIAYKRQLFVMIQDEKPEQNIDMDPSNKAYILYFYPNYQNYTSPLNLSIYYNNSNELILMKSDIIVQIKIENFAENEDLVTETAYTPGIAFLYTSLKFVNLSYKIGENETEVVNQDLQADCDFILYIKDINYEKSENNTKLKLYTSYLAILQLTNRNSTNEEEKHFIYDKKLIDIYEQLRNNSDNHIYIAKNDTWNDSSGFIKLEFYENGEIKKIYYPKIDTFEFKSIDYIREIIDLTIPKISPNLFSQDINSKFNEIQEDLLEVDSIKEKRNILLRRLKESPPQKRKKNKNKTKKIRFRILQENSNDTAGSSGTNETFEETEIIPFEDEIDYELREIKDNGDNTSNITFLSIGDIESNYAKITGSLENKTILTNMDENGKVIAIYQNQNSQFVSGVRDPELDDYIYNNTYNENSYFNKETFLAENETEILTEENPITLKNMNIENHNYIIFLDEFSDDNGKLTEYFNNTIYEEYNEIVSINYALKEMESDYLNKIYRANVSISVTDIIEKDDNNLRELDSDIYPYFGEKIINYVKDVLEKHFLGVTMRTYTETSIYPNTGITLIETISIFGNVKNTIHTQRMYSNNHIILKNKNMMANDLINFLDELIKQINNKTSQIEDEYSNFHELLSKDKPYTYDTLIDEYATQFVVNTDKIKDELHQYSDFIDEADRIASNSRIAFTSTIRSESTKLRDKHINKLDTYYNSNREFNNLVLDLVKTEYEKDNNISFEVMQEIIDDISLLNDYIEDNITQYLANYKDNLSEFTKIEKKSFIYDELNNRISIYNSSLEKFISTLEYINFSFPKLNMTKDNIVKIYRQSVINRRIYLVKMINLIKTYKNGYAINSNSYRDFSNLLSRYLQQEELSLDSQISYLKNYLDIVYTSLHNFLFNFYKEFSKEIFYTLNNIESNNYTSAKEILFEILINITNEYKYIAESDEDIDGHKKLIDKYLLDYRETILKYLYNIKINELIQNYIPSKEFLDIFINNLNEIIDSFESNGEYKNFLQYPKELDYVINTLKLFKDEIKEISEAINNYSKEFILSKIDIIYENTLEYLLKFVDLNKNYLFNNLDKIENLSNLINITDEKFRIEEYFLTEEDIYNNYSSFKSFTNEDLKNFSFINEETLSVFNSSIQNTIDAINKSRILFYNYYHGIDCKNRGCSSGEVINENLNNRFMRYRLELLISYINLFDENLNETYDENDFNTTLINGTNMEEIMESYYISELDKNAYDLIKTDLNNLYEQIDSDIYYIKDTYNEVNYSLYIFEYENILNNGDISFLTTTITKYYDLNQTIYSLIDQYEEILYQFINDYNYTIISFDIFNNYFNSFLQNITDKYESVKTKIKIFKGIEVDKEINRSDINRIFRENLTALMNKRKKSFTEILKNNDIEYKILDKDFLLSDYILQQVSENETINLNYINNKTNIDCMKFVDLIGDAISQFNYPINDLLKNITDEFLIKFKNGNNLTEKDREDITKAYEDEFFLQKNDTYRKCWNLRGKFANEVINEDKINYNNYLDYINKIKVIEECESNGTYDCAYSREDLEEVVYTNETELYQYCLERKKIYGKKQSIFYSMEDFDLDGLNKINEKFQNAINELYSFDHLLTDYIYTRFGLSIYEYVDNETLNIKETTSLIMNTLNESLNEINEKYYDYVGNQLTSKLGETFDFYYFMTYAKADSAFNLFTNMKNRFFVNYYLEKYQIFEALFKELIKNMTSINPSFKNTLIDIFPEIKEDQDKFSSNIWMENIENKILNYYSDTFPNIFINSFFDFIRDKINKENNITILKDNIDNIITKTESSFEFNNVKSSIIENLSTFRTVGFGSNITLGEHTEKIINNSEIEQIVEEITTTASQQKPQIIDEYEKIKNEYLNKINIEYEGFDLDQLVIPLLNNSIYQSFQLSDELDKLMEVLKGTVEVSFDQDAVPDFFLIAYDKSIDYYKEVFEKTKYFYDNIMQIINDVSLFNNTDLIDDKFGNLSGYGLIEGLYHLDPVCNESGCPYRIDFLKYKEEINNNSTRRLSENPFRKEIKAIMEILKEMRDINKNDSDYIFENIINTNRKLSTKYDYVIYDNYDSHCPPRNKNEVKVVLSYLKSAIDELNENFYYYAKLIETEINNKFIDELNVLEKKYLNYLSILEKFFSKKNYKTIESIFTGLMIQLDYYVNGTAGSIISLVEQYLDYINNIYFPQKITGNMVTDKIYNYYEGLDLLIQSKNKNFKENEYESAFDTEQKESKLQNQSQLVSDLMLQTLKAETDMENEIKIEKRKIFAVTEIDGVPIIMEENYSIYLKNKEEYDKYNFTFLRKKEKDERLEKTMEKLRRKNQYRKKEDNLTFTYDKGNMKANIIIKFNWENLLESTIEANAGYEITKNYNKSWPNVFMLPQLPVAQIRVITTATLKLKVYFGAQLTLQYIEDEGPKLNLNGLIKFNANVKIEAAAEGGIYTGMANMYGGISGTLLEADFSFNIIFYLATNEVGLFIGLNINAFQFRIYVEVTGHILIWDPKYILYEKMFGLDEPLLDLKYEVKFDKNGQVISSGKEIHSIFKKKKEEKNIDLIDYD